MKKPPKNYIKINNDIIFYVIARNKKYIPIKPLCIALGVNYIRCFKNIKQDSVLYQLLSIQKTLAADERKRNMVCLPAKFINVWIYSLKSKSIILKNYKEQIFIKE